MANYTEFDTMDFDDESMTEETTDERRDTKRGNKIIGWCKRHKKALALAGITIAVTAVGIYIYKKGKKINADNMKFIDLNDPNADPDMIDAELRDMFDFDIPADAIPENVKDQIADELKNADNHYRKKYDWIEDGLHMTDKSLVWWISDTDLNTSVHPDDVGNDVAKLLDSISDKMGQVLEKVDVNDIQCINMMMTLKD